MKLDMLLDYINISDIELKEILFCLSQSKTTFA